MSQAEAKSATPDPTSIAVIVTGAARGMGRAMTLGLARAGVRVAAADLPSSQNEMRDLLGTAQREGFPDKVFPVDCDVSQWSDCQNTVKAAVGRFGAVHGLVNNAGIGMQGFGHVQVGPRKRFYEHDADAWRRARACCPLRQGTSRSRPTGHFSLRPHTGTSRAPGRTGPM